MTAVKRYFATEFYDGQGLGNQLWVYAFMRSLSRKRQATFQVRNPERFKGINFLDLDFGELIQEDLPLINFHEDSYYDEETKATVHREIEISKIPDNAFLKGNFQSVNFISGDFEEISKWSKCTDLSHLREKITDRTCVINVRGGDYLSRDDLLLYPDYWLKAIRHMTKLFGELDFRIVTDDFKYARKILPGIKLLSLETHGDYFMLQNAPYLILSNSSFAFFPAWTNRNLKYCLAPEYWAGHNEGKIWISEYNLVPSWNYMNRYGRVLEGSSCRAQIEEVKFGLATPTPYLNELQIRKWQGKYYQVTVRNIQHEIRSKISKFIGQIYRRVISKLLIVFKEYRQRFNLMEKLAVKIHILLLRIPFNKKDRISLSSYIPKESINKLRKKVTVFDLFYFHNESDILRLRLKILKNYVDYFVIVESRIGFSGQAKTPFARKICAEFPEITNKFIFIEIDNIPQSRSEIKGLLYEKNCIKKEKILWSRLLMSKDVPLNEGKSQWVREFFIKEYPAVMCDFVQDGDAIFLSDVDEIWNPHSYFSTDLSYPQIFRQRSYHYFLNYRSNENYRGWSGSVLVNGLKFHSFGPNALRTHSTNGVKRRVVAKGGWHFTSQGSREEIQEKFNDASWLGVLTERKELVSRLISTRTHYRNEKIRFKITKRGLPKEILRNLNDYRHMLTNNKLD